MQPAKKGIFQDITRFLPDIAIVIFRETFEVPPKISLEPPLPPTPPQPPAEPQEPLLTDEDKKSKTKT
jgi:hypothetical protein